MNLRNVLEERRPTKTLFFPQHITPHKAFFAVKNWKCSRKSENLRKEL